jgi:hypothetical protein
VKHVVLLIAACILATTGCIEEIHYIDPPVTYSDAGYGEITDELSLHVGIFREQFFTEIENGGELPIVTGFQGGTWVMPALSLTGFQTLVLVNATVTTARGELVGELDDTFVRVIPTPDGTLEVEAVPMAISRERGSVEDLAGVEATFEITVSDPRGAEQSLSLTITLIRG